MQINSPALHQPSTSPQRERADGLPSARCTRGCNNATTSLVEQVGVGGLDALPPVLRDVAGEVLHPLGGAHGQVVALVCVAAGLVLALEVVHAHDVGVELGPAHENGRVTNRTSNHDTGSQCAGANGPMSQQQAQDTHQQ